MAIQRYFLGGMYAGKSLHAINLLLEHPTKNKIILSAHAKKRGFVSRHHPLSSLPHHLVLMQQLSDLLPLLATLGEATIFIDEVQFIEDNTFYQLLQAYHDHPHIHLILAGLSYDQHGNHFANYPQIMQHVPADVVQMLPISCATCSRIEGQVSIRKWQSEDRIVDDYAVLCPSCFASFYREVPLESQVCMVCGQPATGHLRQWHHDLASNDRLSTLCTCCLDAIKTYGHQYLNHSQF
jgi:thymidine kinase